MRPSLSFATMFHRAAPSAAALAGVLAAGGLAHGQAIERNLPPPPRSAAPLITAPNIVPADQDATPIGPALSDLVLLADTDAAVVGSAQGVDASRVPQFKPFSHRLEQFIGRPLSRKLIAQIEAEIATAYRQANHPFVNLTTPAQEITSGILQIRVVEFRLNTKTASSADRKDAPYIESRIRAEPGDVIDTRLLTEDLDWLNRFPFRKSEAVFTPASVLGGSDLKLATTTVKPWSAYATYSDSGTPATGEDRYSLGGQAMLPGLHDAVASYQFTGSGDVFFDDGRPFNTAPNPSYVSQAGRLIIPTLPRQDVEVSLDYVQSNQPVQFFTSKQTTTEATLAYRSALSNIFVPLQGEALIGVEAKRQISRTSFDGDTLLGRSIDVLQILLGYAYQGSDVFGRTSLDLNLHLSPGSVDHSNNDAAFTAFSNGRFDKSQYGYLNGDFTRTTTLPALFGLSGFILVDTLIGQYSAVALPQTEQMGLGAVSLVRGYTLDDGAFDTALVSRNELHLVAFSLIKGQDVAAPYLFLDAGYGKDQRSKATADPASTGLAMDYRFGDHVSATIDGAWALRTTGRTRRGDARLESRVSLSF
jgi:hemolysin activation/secretion protein